MQYNSTLHKLFQHIYFNKLKHFNSFNHFSTLSTLKTFNTFNFSTFQLFFNFFSTFIFYIKTTYFRNFYYAFNFSTLSTTTTIFLLVNMKIYVFSFSIFLLTFQRKCAIMILGGDLVFYIKIRGGTTFISSASNFYYLCDNCLKWFRSDIVVSLYSYPDSVLLATISSGKITFHKMGGAP